MAHLQLSALEAGLADIRDSPKDRGRVELIVCRPAENEREVLTDGALDPAGGLVGDVWKTRGSSRTADGSAHPDMQLTLMNVRAASLIAADPARRQLAGDQFFVDLDLSYDNLPVGTRLAIGSAVIEITGQLHTGCGKFSKRFGVDALKFVNSASGRELNLRGIYARTVSAGVVRPGDAIAKLQPPVAATTTEAPPERGLHRRTSGYG